MSFRRSLPALSALLLLLLPPLAEAANGQDAPLLVPVQWRLVTEIVGIAGGTWLEGPRIPTVGNRAGYAVALGTQRNVGPYGTAGLMLRGGQQMIRLRQEGEQWDGGAVTEANVLAAVSVQSRTTGAIRLSLDVSGGAAILSGASEILPFRDATRLSPLVEVGGSVRRGSVGTDASRRDVSLLVRYSALRLDSDPRFSVTTSGWVGRIHAGLRMTR